MKLKDLLTLISNVAKKENLSTPFIVGGIPRDKLANRLNSISDIDFTTGNADVHYLAKEIAFELKELKPNYQVMNDGHARIILGDLKLDFSSNFIIPNAVKTLNSLGRSNLSNMELEIYSRDFTCNTLLLSLDLKDIKDLTQRGISDINKKLLRTCLPPELTLGLDHKRVVRVIYLAAKLGFTVDEYILNWIKLNPSTFSNVPIDYLSKKLLKSFSYNEQITSNLLSELNLWPYVPATDPLTPFIKKNI
jgi:tRNA nucleotidyltransferase/poly(A) polymerase